jgi:hypothetical protein
MNQKYGLHCSKKFCDQLKIQVAAHSTNSVFGLRRRTVKNDPIQKQKLAALFASPDGTVHHRLIPPQVIFCDQLIPQKAADDHVLQKSNVYMILANEGSTHSVCYGSLNQTRYKGVIVQKSVMKQKKGEISKLTNTTTNACMDAGHQVLEQFW